VGIPGSKESLAGSMEATFPRQLASNAGNYSKLDEPSVCFQTNPKKLRINENGFPLALLSV